MSEPVRRARTLWPLPGGAGHYLSAASDILGAVRESSDTEVVLSSVLDTFSEVTSVKSARSYLHVLGTLGLISLDGPVVRLSLEGKRFLASGDQSIIVDALLTRVAGVSELLELLSEKPQRIGLLQERLATFGYAWTSQGQLRHRLRWLEEVGIVTRHGLARPEYRVSRRLPAQSN